MNIPDSSDLVVFGTDADRVLTALGALHAYTQGDDEAVALYPTLFAEGYLEYGFMGLATGLISSVPDYNEIIGDLAGGHFAESPRGLYLLSVCRGILDDEEYFIPMEPVAISNDNWQALIDVALALLGRFATHRGLALSEVLDFFQAEMTKRVA